MKERGTEKKRSFTPRRRATLRVLEFLLVEKRKRKKEKTPEDDGILASINLYRKKKAFSGIASQNLLYFQIFNTVNDLSSRI